MENTVGTYMRILRATYNRAVYEGLVPQDALLFRLVCTGIEAQTKRALETKEIGLLLYPSEDQQ